MIKQELEWVSKNVSGKLGSTFSVSECQTFVPTAPGHEPGHEGTTKYQQRMWTFCITFRVDRNPSVSSALVYKSTDGSFLRHAGNREQDQSASTWLSI